MVCKMIKQKIMIGYCMIQKDIPLIIKKNKREIWKTPKIQSHIYNIS